MAILFDDLLKQAARRGMTNDQSKASVDWFRGKAQAMQSGRATFGRAKEDAKLVQRPTIGKMYLFQYDAKGKKELPYWDRVPLVFPIQPYPDGFLGINLHYLPHVMRAKLMDALMSTMSNQKMDESTRLRLSYDLLNSTSRFKWFKPCIKRYLGNHVRSQFVEIPSSEWNLALMMPLQRFVGATSEQVWKDSRRMIR